MTSGLYDKGRQKFGEAAINWASDTIKVVPVDGIVYTVNLATHEFLTDLGAIPAAFAAVAATLGSKTFTNGVADAADISFATVLALTNTVSALVIYKDTGTAATSPLIAYVDSVTGFPIVNPSSLTIPITWDNGANKIFKL